MANNNMQFTLGIKTNVDMSGLNELKRTLKELGAVDTDFLQSFSAEEVEKVTTSVRVLENALDSAFDINLNGINFSTFQKSIQNSGMSLNQIKANLATIGPEGTAAFAKVTSQVYQLNTAVQYTNKFTEKLFSSFKNTVMYTGFNAMLNTLSKTVSQSVGYIKDLDRSLNDIRIVTEKSADDMAKFAVQANNAAQALGTTTTDYTDASLIYYQQGLSDEEVIERTNVTIKMANALGTSAEQVSEDMTAIWNNFADGSHELEYYSDVITALGASTASSAEEISQGLEKFAAVADTVGLSYEYATSALATVTAETRQSADVVGTAFKTLFARIQDLELGETLDDGTTLGKYSQALEAVGINIKDATGNLKSMDTILDEMGSKWNTLGKDTQVALAQTVAGTRQYTQLIALMSNWDVFQENLQTAAKSAGTLTKQQNIYMDSMEAHMNKLKAASEDLYSSLFDSDDVKSFYDMLTGLVKVVDHLVESFGGLAGIIPAALAMGVGSTTGQLATFFSQNSMNKANQERLKLEETNKLQTLRESVSNPDRYDVNGETAKTLEQQEGFYHRIYENASLLTEEERKQFNELSQSGQKLLENKSLIETMQGDYTKWNSIIKSISEEDFNNFDNLGVTQQKLVLGASELQKIWQGISTEIEKNYSDTNTMSKSDFDSMMVGIENDFGNTINFKNLDSKLKAGGVFGEDEDGNRIANHQKALAIIEQEIEKTEQLRRAVNDVAGAQESVIAAQEQFAEAMEDRAATKNWMDIATGITTVAASMNGLIKLQKVWSSDANFGEKLLKTVTSLALYMPILHRGLSKLQEPMQRNLEAAKLQKDSIDNLISKRKDQVKALEALTKAEEESRQKEREENNAAIEEKEKLLEELEAERAAIAGVPELITEDDIKLIDEKTESIQQLTKEIEDLNIANEQSEINENKVKEKNNADISKINEEIEVLEEDSEKADAKVKELSKTFDYFKHPVKFAKDALKAFCNGGLAGVKKFIGEIIGSLKKPGEQLLKLMAELGPIGWAILGITAAITAGVAIYKSWQKELKNTAATLRTQYEQQKKIVEATKEQYDNIVKLREAYEDLNEESKLSQVETYKLCMQYGEEELAIKALTAGYDDLLDVMNQVEAERASQYNTEAKTQGEYAKNALGASLKAQAGWRIDKVNGIDTIDLKGMSSQNTAEQKEKEALENLASTYGIEDLFVNNDHIDLNKLESLLSKDANALSDILNVYDTEMSKQLQGYFSNISEDIDNIAEATKVVKEASLQAFSTTLTDSKVDSANYLQTRENQIQELIDNGVYSENERSQAESDVDAILSNYSSEGIKNSIALNLAESLYGDNASKEFENIAKFNISELTFFVKLQDYIKLTNKDLEELAETYEGVVQASSNNNFTASLPAVLTAANEKGKFEEEDIDTLFPDGRPEIKLQTGLVINREEFENSDFETQTRIASQALLEGLINTSKNAEITEQAISDLQAEIDSLSNDITVTFADSINVTGSNFEKLEEIIDYNKNELIDYYSAFKDIDFSSFTEEQLQNLEDLVNNSEASVSDYINFLREIGDEDFANYLQASLESEEGITGDTIKSLKDYMATQGAVEKYTRNITNVTNELITEMDALKAGTVNAAEANTEIEKQYKNIGSTIDMLQSQYSSLQSVVDDYNDNGKLSIDSIQQLVEMDNAFVASLELENGQLKINNETYSSLMDVQMAYMRQQVMADLITDLHILKEGEAADATDELDRSYSELGDTVLQTATKVAAGTELLEEFTNDAYALAGLSASDFGVNADAAEEAIQAAYNKLKLMGSVDYFEGTGSGSGSDKTSKKDTKDYDDEYDRYWDINNAIEKVTHALEQLDKAQEKLSRNELISSLREENKLLEIQAQKYQDLAAEQNKEAAELREQLQGYGIIFDNEGQIQNYLAQTKMALDQYNSVVEQYNAGGVSDESFEAYEADYNKFKDLLDKYDSLYYDKMVETQDKLEEITRQIKENNLTGWETELTLKLDTKSAERDWNDFIGEISEDFQSIWTDFGTKFKTSVFNAVSLGGDTGTIMDEMQAAKEVMAEIDKMEAGGDSSMFESISQAQDKLAELRDQMKDDAESLFNLYQEGWDNYNSAIDETITKFDNLEDAFERINSDLNHQAQIIELLYGENAYDYLDKLYSTQSQNFISQLASLRDTGAFYKAQYEEAVAAYGADSDAADKFKKAWESTIDELHEKEEAYIENLAKEYANTISKAFHDAEKQLMGGSTYSFVSEQWDLAKTAADGVYDDQERIYQLEKLSLKYYDAIEKASTTKAQQKLQDLYESQVKALEDKTTLTEYDVELAEKRLAVAQAEADLEDAQNNKNSLKVTRDTAGNWSYQYVADEGDIDNKQQALLDAQYEAYEFVKQNVSDLKEEMIQLAEDWSNTIADLESKMIGATEEEKAQYQMMIDWYNSYYAEQMNTKADELKAHEINLAEETNALLATEYMVNADQYANMTDKQKACIDELSKYALEGATDVYNAAGEAYDAIVTLGDDAMRETIDYFSTAASAITDVWANNPDSVKNAMLEAMTVCTQAQIEYSLAVEEGCVAAGENFADVEAQIEENIDATNDLEDATSDLVDTATRELDEYETYLGYLRDAWYNVRDAVMENGEEMERYINKIGEAQEAMIDFVNVLDQAIAKELELKSVERDGGGRTPRNTTPDSSSSSSGRYKIQEQYGGNYGVWDTETNNWIKIAGTGADGYNQILHDLVMQNTTFSNGVSIGKLQEQESGLSSDELLKYIMNAGLTFDSYNSSGDLTYSNSSKSDPIYDVLHLWDKIIPSKYATGGYTGDWNSDGGRLAFLHQKELVLNAGDTENILGAVSAIRDLSSINSSIQTAVAESIASALGRINSAIGGSGVIGNTDNSSSNVYNINAEFPAANDVNDIREALLSLPNLAAQRAAQKTL